jgi:arginase
LTLEKTGSSLRQRRIKKQRHENIYSKEREEKMSSHKPMVLIDAPSNLGLRPPVPGAVPGVYKLAGALRDQGLLPWLGARDGGVVIPPRYLPDWDGHTVRNGPALAIYSQRLADRVQQHCAAGECPLVLSGDCSILLGPMLALVTGREGPELANLEGRGPLVQDSDVVAIGFRSDDASAPEVQQTAMTTFSVAQLQQDGPTQVGLAVLETFQQRRVEGYWLHQDVDVGGLTFQEVTDLLHPLLRSEGVVGWEVTIFDPDLDPDGFLAQRLTEALVAAVNPLLEDRS